MYLSNLACNLLVKIFIQTWRICFNFDYALEDSESILEYEFDDSIDEELKDDKPTKQRTKHINQTDLFHMNFTLSQKKSYILMVESLKHNFTPSIYMIIIANLIFSKW